MSSLLRDTAQRRAIRAVLEKASRPMTCHAIHAAAQLSLPQLSFVTVYRVLHAFENERVVSAVIVPGRAPHYELARGHHHHFFCRNCRQVTDVPCDGHPAPPKIAPRFKVEDRQVLLIGLCPDCAEAA